MTDKQVIWHNASRSEWQEYAYVKFCIFFPLAPGVWETGDQKGLHTCPRTGIYLPTEFGCDRSIVVGCRSWNDWETSRQTDKQNGMTIRLTLCERDAVNNERLNVCHLSTNYTVSVSCSNVLVSVCSTLLMFEHSDHVLVAVACALFTHSSSPARVNDFSMLSPTYYL